MNINTSLSGLMAAQKRFQVSGHNVANANTPDYKSKSAIQTSGEGGTVKVNVKETNQPTDIVEEMINQKMALYDVHANAQAIKTADEILGKTIDIKA